MDDSALIARFKAGDSGAFDVLVERHQETLLRYARGQCGGSLDAAADAVQEAFLAMIHAVRNGKDILEPIAWLYRVVRNRAFDARRKDRRMIERHQEAARQVATAQEPPPGERLEDEEKRSALRLHFSSLESEVQEILRLKMECNRSYREIATITGHSLAQVSRLIHGGLDHLAQRLRGAGVI
ncbi:MAG TPA: sigma-70 family RNA polymerase sigma factor [Planctomycetes bacterium]|nr:sigma-70 family RNA polymerase sigma factor [Planctomycetota bacterium]